MGALGTTGWSAIPSMADRCGLPQGWSGNDTLDGVGGRDIFGFDAGSGRDTIPDFKLGEDQIDLRAWALHFLRPSPSLRRPGIHR
jgi:hypothetical protein